MRDGAFDNKELLTARLSLRPPSRADVGAILSIHANPLTSLHNPSDALTTRGEAQRLFERWSDHWRRYGYGYWVVRRRDSIAPIGFCGFKSVQFNGRSTLNLFYRFHPSAWGNGLASEAATAVVKWAAQHLPEQPIIARVRPENIASQRVATHAGLVRAETLDSPGEDGFDWIYASNWSAG